MTDKPDSEQSAVRNASVASPAVADDVGQSPGQLLRQARNRLDLTIEELVAQTRLPRTILEALEDDDFRSLREPTYVRGYYRKCATILNIPEETLIASYEQLTGTKRVRAPVKPLLLPDDLGHRRHGRHRYGRRSVRWRGFAFVIAITVGAGVWYLHAHVKAGHFETATAMPTSSNPGSSVVASKVGKVQHQISPQVNVMATPSSVSAPLPSSTLSVRAVGSSTPAGAVVDGASDKPTQIGSEQPAVSTKVPDDNDALRLNFREASWVRIEDSTGKILLSGLIGAGEHKTLPGKPPYSVFLGNALGVQVEYNGHAINVRHYTKSNSTARFAVPKP